jgi:hypothetical protein
VPSEIATVIDLLGSAEFLTGLAAGAAMLAVLLGAPIETRVWGVAVAAATITGIALTHGVDLTWLAGIAVLALAGVWVGNTPTTSTGIRQMMAWGGLVVGAVLTTASLEVSLPMRLTASVVLLGAGFLLSLWSRTTRFSLLGGLFAVTAAGIWLTVPDTDTARVLLGTAVVSAVATLKPFRARLTASGSFALMGVVVSVVATGGAAREGSIIAGWACLGLLVLLPMLGVDRTPPRDPTVVLIHLVAVIVASRVIGPWESAFTATLGVAILATATYAAIWFAATRPG